MRVYIWKEYSWLVISHFLDLILEAWTLRRDQKHSRESRHSGTGDRTSRSSLEGRRSGQLKDLRPQGTSEVDTPRLPSAAGSGTRVYMATPHLGQGPKTVPSCPTPIWGKGWLSGESGMLFPWLHNCHTPPRCLSPSPEPSNFKDSFKLD